MIEKEVNLGKFEKLSSLGIKLDKDENQKVVKLTKLFSGSVPSYKLDNLRK